MSLKPTDRLFALDAIRALSILSMMVFHFCYDLNYFGYIECDTPNGKGFREWRCSILIGFIFSMGVSIALSHARHRKPKKLLKWLTKIAICAITLTLLSLVMYPKDWIYFGILHFIIIGGLLSYTLLSTRWLPFTLGTILVLSFYSSRLDGGSGLYWFPFSYSDFFPTSTVDYVALIPWAGVSLIGSALGKHIEEHPTLKHHLIKFNIQGPLGNFIQATSKHSLLIYMVHQPIFYGLIYTAMYCGLKP